jgi:hypothetical protein
MNIIYLILFTVLLHIISTYVCYIRGKELNKKFKNNKKKRLPDIVHDILPETTNKYISFIREITPLIPLLLLCHVIYKTKYYKLIHEYVKLFCIIYIVRSIMMVSTTLPDPTLECKYSLYGGSCNDLLFSGHISSMFLSILFLCAVTQSEVLHNSMYTLLIFTILLILSSRRHYTIDIIVSLFVVYSIFLVFYKCDCLQL